MYPDTYRIRPNGTADDVIRTMLREFQKKIGNEYETQGASAYKTLILASIVEREDGNEQNQPIIAGILQKRVAEKTPM